MVNEKKEEVKISQAGMFGVAFLATERNKFHVPFNSSLATGHYDRVFIATNPKNSDLVLGYLIVKVVPTKPAQLVLFSTRKGYERRGIGRQLFGKVRGYLHKIGVTKVVTAGEIAKGSIGFYRDFLKMREVKGSGASQFELSIRPNARIKKPKIKPLPIQPQNLLRKDTLISRRMRVRR